jgi:hypothetical protein
MSDVTGYVMVDVRVWVATKAEIERLRAQLASTQYHIRRWQSGTQVVGVHRSCGCPICETLYGVDTDGPTDKQDEQLAAAKELLRDVLLQCGSPQDSREFAVMVSSEWRERAKEITG